MREREVAGRRRPGVLRLRQHTNALLEVQRFQLTKQHEGAIARGIVHDQHVVAVMPNSGNHPLEVLALVEGRQHDQHLGGRRLALGEVPFRLHPRSRSRMTCFSMSTELRTGLTLVGAELRQTTGTSAIFTPCFRARYRTSGS